MSNQKNFSCPIDVCIFVENSDKDEDYEFDENDSHITQLVKHFCDSDKDHSDSDSINKLNTKFFNTNQKTKESSHSCNSRSTQESQTSPPILFKISCIYKKNMNKRIIGFKCDLFQKFFPLENFNSKTFFEYTGLLNESKTINLSPQISKSVTTLDNFISKNSIRKSLFSSQQTK